MDLRQRFLGRLHHKHSILICIDVLELKVDLLWLRCDDWSSIRVLVGEVFIEPLLLNDIGIPNLDTHHVGRGSIVTFWVDVNFAHLEHGSIVEILHILWLVRLKNSWLFKHLKDRLHLSDNIHSSCGFLWGISLLNIHIMESELLSSVSNSSWVAHNSLSVMDSNLTNSLFLDHTNEHLLSTWDVDVGELHQFIIGNIKVWDSNALSEMVRVDVELKLILVTESTHTELVNEVLKFNLEWCRLVIFILVIAASRKVDY